MAGWGCPNPPVPSFRLARQVLQASSYWDHAQDDTLVLDLLPYMTEADTVVLSLSSLEWKTEWDCLVWMTWCYFCGLKGSWESIPERSFPEVKPCRKKCWSGFSVVQRVVKSVRVDVTCRAAQKEGTGMILKPDWVHLMNFWLSPSEMQWLWDFLMVHTFSCIVDLHADLWHPYSSPILCLCTYLALNILHISFKSSIRKHDLQNSITATETQWVSCIRFSTHLFVTAMPASGATPSSEASQRGKSLPCLIS